jgi:hypothetical protein
MNVTNEEWSFLNETVRKQQIRIRELESNLLIMTDLESDRRSDILECHIHIKELEAERDELKDKNEALSEAIDVLQAE